VIAFDRDDEVARSR